MPNETPARAVHAGQVPAAAAAWAARVGAGQDGAGGRERGPLVGQAGAGGVGLVAGRHGGVSSWVVADSGGRGEWPNTATWAARLGSSST